MSHALAAIEGQLIGLAVFVVGALVWRAFRGDR
jgi:hypothetical protein